jgi:hypothetical protein
MVDNTNLWGEKLGIELPNNGKLSSTKRPQSNPLEDIAYMKKQIDQQLKGLREEVIEYKRDLAKTHLDFVASIDNKLLNMISYQEFITFKLEMQDTVREHSNRVIAMIENGLLKEKEEE